MEVLLCDDTCTTACQLEPALNGTEKPLMLLFVKQRKTDCPAFWQQSLGKNGGRLRNVVSIASLRYGTTKRNGMAFVDSDTRTSLRLIVPLAASVTDRNITFDRLCANSLGNNNTSVLLRSKSIPLLRWLSFRSVLNELCYVYSNLM